MLHRPNDANEQRWRWPADRKLFYTELQLGRRTGCTLSFNYRTSYTKSNGVRAGSKNVGKLPCSLPSQEQLTQERIVRILPRG
jgi:hypothetical protein